MTMMKRVAWDSGLTRMLFVACAAMLPLSSAHAQDPLSRFLDGVFKQERPSRQPQPAPLPPPLPDPAQAAPQPPLPGGPTPSAPVQPEPLAQPVQVPSQAGGVPMPPRRPAGLGGAVATPAIAAPTAAPVAQPVATPAQQARAPQQGALPANASEAVARVNAYLNSINTLNARFLQTGADRQQVGGTLFVQRPGRLRFAYDPPSTLEIVADGRSVAVRDSRLRTNDVYSIGQTPLKFLLRDNVDLARDVRLRDAQIDPGGLVSISLEDSATLGGTSRVTLHFDAHANVLRGWRIVDPQGYETEVALSGVEVARR